MIVNENTEAQKLSVIMHWIQTNGYHLDTILSSTYYKDREREIVIMI